MLRRVERGGRGSPADDTRSRSVVERREVGFGDPSFPYIFDARMI
jgi:hypothetical protein